QHDPLARLGRAALEAPSPHIEGQCRDEHAAEHGHNGTGQLCHGSISTSPPDPLHIVETGNGGEGDCQPAISTFRFAGGSIFARSSATAARRTATSRSACFA